jgi:hypothetical protein
MNARKCESTHLHKLALWIGCTLLHSQVMQAQGHNTILPHQSEKGFVHARINIQTKNIGRGLRTTHHSRKHGTKAPHVERVVILAVVHQELGALEIARCDSHVVLGAGAVELRQTPINQAQLPLCVYVVVCMYVCYVCVCV